MSDSDLIQENLKLKQAFEDILVCKSILKAERIARKALQEVTASEAAEIMGITRQHVHNLVNQQQVRSRRIGRLRLIPESELERIKKRTPDLLLSRPMKTSAVMKCAEWLCSCLELGWAKADLDELQALWWRCHDVEGNVLGERR